MELTSDKTGITFTAQEAELIWPVMGRALAPDASGYCTIEQASGVLQAVDRAYLHGVPTGTLGDDCRMLRGNFSPQEIADRRVAGDPALYAIGEALGSLLLRYRTRALHAKVLASNSTAWLNTGNGQKIPAQARGTHR